MSKKIFPKYRFSRRLKPRSRRQDGASNCRFLGAFAAEMPLALKKLTLIQAAMQMRRHAYPASRLFFMAFRSDRTVPGPSFVDPFGQDRHQRQSTN